MRANSIRWAAMMALMFGVAPLARADLLDTVLHNYAAAGTAIESRACHGTYQVTRTQTGRQGEATVEDQLTIRMNGDQFSIISHVTRSVTPSLPVGTDWVCGGSRTQYFSAIKTAGRKDFVISAYGNDTNAVAKFRNQAFPVVAPFAITGMTVGELLYSGKFTPISAESTTANGAAAIIVRFKAHDSSFTTKSLAITLLADSLSLLSYDVELPKSRLRGENTYRGTGGTPELQQAETWVELNGSPTRVKDQKVVIQSFANETVPETAFTPKAVGLAETPVESTISPPRD